MIATFTLLAALAQTNQDFATIDSTINTLYTVISGEAGAKRDWDKFKSLFVPGGMLRATVKTQTGTRRLVEFTPDQYIERNGPAFERQAFYEKEIFRKTDQFGDIANVFSTYSSSATKDGEPFQRGINTIQMRYDGTRWWIVSLLWQGETADTPLPKQYLPGG
jgi:hypothetical protein